MKFIIIDFIQYREWLAVSLLSIRVISAEQQDYFGMKCFSLSSLGSVLWLSEWSRGKMKARKEGKRFTLNRVDQERMNEKKN